MSFTEVRCPVDRPHRKTSGAQSFEATVCGRLLCHVSESVSRNSVAIVCKDCGTPIIVTVDRNMIELSILGVGNTIHTTNEMVVTYVD